MAAMASGPPTSAEAHDPTRADAGRDLLSTSQAGPAAVRGGALRLASYVGGSLLALAAGAILYRHLGPVKTGRYTKAISLVALVAGASDLGLTAIGIRELSVRRGEERARMEHTMLGLRLVVTIVGVAAVTLFALVAYGATLGAGVLLAGAGLVFQVWQGTLALPLMADLRFGWAAAFEFLRQLLLSIVIIALVLAGSNLLGFLAATIPAGAVVLVFMLVRFRGEVSTGLRFAPREWRALVKPVISYAVAVAAATLYFRVAILLVSAITNERELGYFSLSFNVMAALFAVPAMLVTAAFPIFARAAKDDHARLAYGIERVFEVSLIVGAWMSLAIALGASLAIEIVGGHKFAPGASILAIQGISVGATFVGTVWGFGLLSLGRHRAILTFNLVALVAVVVAVSVLASVDGAHGAAIGTSFVEVACAVIGARVLISGREHLRPSMRVVPKVAVALSLAALPALLPIPEAAQIAVSGLIYIVLLAILRALPSELLALIPHRRPRHA
jgi:O-antigen/teichoic acid export membrane protein